MLQLKLIDWWIFQFQLIDWVDQFNCNQLLTTLAYKGLTWKSNLETQNYFRKQLKFKEMCDTSGFFNVPTLRTQVQFKTGTWLKGIHLPYDTPALFVYSWGGKHLQVTIPLIQF